MNFVTLLPVVWANGGGEQKQTNKQKSNTLRGIKVFCIICIRIYSINYCVWGGFGSVNSSWKKKQKNTQWHKSGNPTLIHLCYASNHLLQNDLKLFLKAKDWVKTAKVFGFLHTRQNEHAHEDKLKISFQSLRDSKSSTCGFWMYY